LKASFLCLCLPTLLIITPHLFTERFGIGLGLRILTLLALLGIRRR